MEIESKRRLGRGGETIRPAWNMVGIRNLEDTQREMHRELPRAGWLAIHVRSQGWRAAMLESSAQGESNQDKASSRKEREQGLNSSENRWGQTGQDSRAGSLVGKDSGLG